MALVGGLCVYLTAQAQTAFTPPSRAPLQTALRDPFSSFVPQPLSPRQVRRSMTPAVPAPVAAPLQAPILPALDLVFMGRIQTPAGVQVLAQHLGQPMLLLPGTALVGGYVVQSVTAREVALRNEAQNHVARWALPVAPIFETR